ncbi:hypothetical protein SAMN04488074_102237 [Lentzea albidocapillata subsp. violacea]|uniref:Uncharacterized protein n=1 Tax=Lentzea albidocapillata subsp. violacea TaxID=128104 RepID=A0A1G8UAF3_9PSEU|nr:hypothetical protein [Lentzea albidocapillata]SDJ50703.1 hypothetical protein SAMN04488074_102237 [Lentzea albidocapillata subsp. violacea]
MSTEVRITSMADHEYAAEVHEGTETTTHHVVLTQGFLDDLAVQEPDGPTLVEEIIRYLLDREPNTAVPHELDPAALVGQDAEFLPELRRRLGAE